MQDLSAYQADPAPTDPAGAEPEKQRTKTMMRSKSESYSRGERRQVRVCINGFWFKSIGLTV